MCAPFRPSVLQWIILHLHIFSLSHFACCKFPAHHKFLSVKRMHEKNIHHRSVCRLTEWISSLFQRGIESFSLAAELSCAWLQLLNFGNMGKLSRERERASKERYWKFHNVFSIFRSRCHFSSPPVRTVVLQFPVFRLFSLAWVAFKVGRGIITFSIIPVTSSQISHTYTHKRAFDCAMGEIFRKKLLCGAADNGIQAFIFHESPRYQPFTLIQCVNKLDSRKTHFSELSTAVVQSIIDERRRN